MERHIWPVDEISVVAPFKMAIMGSAKTSGIIHVQSLTARQGLILLTHVWKLCCFIKVLQSFLVAVTDICLFEKKKT